MATGIESSAGEPGLSTLVPGNVAIAYDAAAGTYRVSFPGFSRIFRSQDLTSQNATTRTFVRTQGAITDRLVLTNPGTSGSLTYRYVGAGIWTRASTDEGHDRNFVAAFTYGVPTPASDIVTTGTGSYLIDLLATSSRFRYEGTGKFLVDFASGALRVDATAEGVARWGDPLTSNATFFAQGQLGSGSAFAGDFRFSADSTDWDGMLNGRFYGPDAAEVGASFASPARTAR